MRKMIWLLALCCCATTASMAGPNAGGVLWAHDTGISVTTDPITTWPADPAVSGCPGSVDNQMPVTTAAPIPTVGRYWKVYAAFPAGSAPRLNSVGWKTEYDDNVASPYSYVNVLGGDVCNGEVSPSTVFFIGGAGFPTANGGTIGQSFPQGARLTLVTPLFMFWGVGYNAGGAYACPTWRTAAYAGNTNFGDDFIPANLDPIAGYSSLGFGCAGTTRCPIPTPGGCCAPSGVCTTSLPLACQSPSVWQWKACDPNPCPQPTGACCNTAAGYPSCVIATAAECAAYLPVRTWLGAGTVCNVTTCPVPPPTGNCCNHAIPECTVVTQTACNASGFEWLGTASCDVQTICLQPTGNCCDHAVPQCTVVTEAACLASGFEWLGVVACDVQTNCQAPTGNCCNRAIPECGVTTQAACEGAGLEWLGTAPCDVQTICVPPMGSCCYTNGSCLETTEAQCVGGLSPEFTQITDQGLAKAARQVIGIWTEGVSCTPNPCPQPDGACCMPDGSCQTLTNADCTTAGGLWQGYPSDCATAACPQPDGACCMPDGSCQDISDAACTTAGGQWQGYPSACATAACPQPAGACCLPDGSCQDITDADCTTAGGQWQGYLSNCQTAGCSQPLGSCCLPDGDCLVMTEADCIIGPTHAKIGAAWGVWTEGGNCTPNLCVQPAGACCLPDGSCQDLTAVDCTAANGTWRGFPSACATTTDCVQPDGACCMPNGSCQILTDARCVAAGGQWQGYPTDCATNPCAPPTGSCCYADGTCAETTEANCVPPVGNKTAVYGIWTEGGTCTPNICVQPNGACCLPDGSCLDLTAVDCTTHNGQWRGYATYCATTTDCPQPQGACCHTAVGMPDCSITTAANCEAQGYAWLGADIPCNTTTCPPPAPPSGSCCAAGGQCTVTTQADCAVTSTWTLGGVCVPNTCRVPETGSCCFRNSYCMLFTPTRCATLHGTWVGDAACTPSTTPRCLVLPSKDGDPSLDQSAPSQQKDSWGQIKNRYR